MIDGECMLPTLPALRAGRHSPISLSLHLLYGLQFSDCHLDDYRAASTSSSSNSSLSTLAAITILMLRESMSSLLRAVTLPIAIHVSSSVALDAEKVAY